MFRGRPLESRTEYEYDDTGRLLRSRTFHEATWTTEDHAEALALQLYEQGLCPCGCGQPRVEAWDEMNDDAYTVPDDLPVCQARLALERWYRDNPEDRRPPGQIVHVVYTPEDPHPTD